MDPALCSDICATGQKALVQIPRAGYDWSGVYIDPASAAAVTGLVFLMNGSSGGSGVGESIGGSLGGSVCSSAGSNVGSSAGSSVGSSIASSVGSTSSVGGIVGGSACGKTKSKIIQLAKQVIAGSNPIVLKPYLSPSISGPSDAILTMTIEEYVSYRLSTNRPSTQSLYTVVSLMAYKERGTNDAGIILTESRPVTKGGDKINLPQVGTCNGLHAELLGLQTLTEVKMKKLVYREFESFYLDVSDSPCVGCKENIEKFIETQIGFAQAKKAIFTMTFSYYKTYDGIARSCGQSKPDDPKTQFEQAISTGGFIKAQMIRSQQDPNFDFYYYDDLRDQSDFSTLTLF